LYAYDAEESGELSLKENEWFRVIDVSAHDGWFVGQLVDGKKGIFPGNFTNLDQVLSTGFREVKGMFDYNAQEEGELSFLEDENITLLDTETEHEGWWRGACQGVIGLFPYNFVSKPE